MDGRTDVKTGGGPNHQSISIVHTTWLAVSTLDQVCLDRAHPSSKLKPIPDICLVNLGVNADAIDLEDVYSRNETLQEQTIG